MERFKKMTERITKCNGLIVGKYQVNKKILRMIQDEYILSFFVIMKHLEYGRFCDNVIGLKKVE